MDKAIFDKLFDEYEPLHRREELHQLVNLVGWFSPRAILELGVARGGSFKMWEYLLPSDGLLIGVDRLNIVGWHWNNSSKDVRYFQGDIVGKDTYEKVRGVSQRIDFLYIDSNHYYEGFKQHFDLYAPLVREGGLVAFHDIRDNKGSGYGVGRYFNELKEHKNWMEILVPGEDRGPGADGIGVIFK